MRWRLRGAIRVVAVLCAAVALVVGAAGPADAHAVLLRTVPSPQTTVPRPPADVRLEFSERVEVAFGAVRVFDVDGHRVDEGKVATTDGGRDVVVPARLGNGTYTVTWRVVSADGHPVRGGFQFYVGAPSTISPVAIAGEAGAGRVVGWGYGVVRFAWFGALAAVVGLVAVRRFVWTPAVRAAGLADSEAAAGFRRRFARALPTAWVVLSVAWLCVLAFQAASVSGLGLVSSIRPDVFGEVLRTSFGHAWLAGLAFTVVVAFPVVGLTRRGLGGVRPETWLALLAAGAVGLSLAAAGSGHARTEGHPSVGVPSVAAHLLAVSVWVGGLAGLVGLGTASWRSIPAEDRNRFLGEIVPRFSRMAIVAVGVVVVTGVVNAVLDLAGLGDMWHTTYGRVLSAKIVLLAAALGFGARHLWVMPRRLAAADPAARAVRSFNRSVTAELVVVAAVVAFASGLVALVPGRSLALVAQGPVNQERPGGRYAVQLFVDPTALGSNEVHVTFVDQQGLGATEVTSVQVTLGPAGAPGAPLAVRLISPGHFVGEAELPRPGPYRLTVQTAAVSPPASATFMFRLRGTARAAGR